jgi:hypothetical protein
MIDHFSMLDHFKLSVRGFNTSSPLPLRRSSVSVESFFMNQVNDLQCLPFLSASFAAQHLTMNRLATI